jgi:hypothetical protein
MIVRTKRFAARLLLGASLLALPALSVACRDSDGNDGTPDATPGSNPDGGPDNPDDTTIYEVQGDLAEDLPVNVRGVVVVAIDNYGNEKYSFFVAEPTGAREYSGVQVYNTNPVLIADLAVGDLVDLEGVIKDEFVFGDAQSFGPSLTQLRAPQGGTFSVVKVGSGTVPEPAVVDPVAIGALDTAAEKAAWEPYEGVLVRTTNAAVTAGYSQIGNSDPSFKEFRIKFETRIDSGLSELPAELAVGDCYASVTGIVQYFFNFKIVPRQPSDIDTAPGTCTGPSDTTIAAIQRGEVTGDVRLNDVIVTGRDDVPNNVGIWVADAVQAAPYQGIFVYLGRAAAAADITVGTTVDVAGSVSELDFPMDNPVGDKLTQIGGATVTRVDVAAVAPLPVTNATIAQLSAIGAAGEEFEGVLARLANLKVESHNGGNDNDDTIVLTDGAGGTIFLDGDAFDYELATYPVGTCFSSVTGLMSVQLTRNVRTINPRSAADVVVVACPAPAR